MNKLVKHSIHLPPITASTTICANMCGQTYSYGTFVQLTWGVLDADNGAFWTPSWMLIVPKSLKWKNSNLRTGSTISIPLLALANQVLLAEIHILFAYVLSLAHVALQSSAKQIKQRTVLHNVRAVSCLFLHELMFTQPWATSFT